MNWTPINKRTGAKYPPVTDEIKLAFEADSFLKRKYRFVPADDRKYTPINPENMNIAAAGRKPKAAKEIAPPEGVREVDPEDQE